MTVRKIIEIGFVIFYLTDLRNDTEPFLVGCLNVSTLGTRWRIIDPDDQTIDFSRKSFRK